MEVASYQPIDAMRFETGLSLKGSGAKNIILWGAKNLPGYKHYYIVVLRDFALETASGMEFLVSCNQGAGQSGNEITLEQNFEKCPMTRR